MNKLYITTFGGFSISYKNYMISDTDNRSKKIWTLLEYIVVNHDSSISSNSLFDLLWADDLNKTALDNNLKVCLHRVRELLKQLHHPEPKLILYKRNHFTLNPDVEYEIDTTTFEKTCSNTTDPSLSIETRIKAYHKIFDIYCGRFLPNTMDADWVIPLSNYYHSLYITTVHSFFRLLTSKNDFNQLYTYSYQAIQVDPYNEIFQYYYILSLYKTGHAQDAVLQYEQVIQKYYDMFGINPSNEFKSLYSEIIKKDTVTQDDINTILADLKKTDSQKNAYECNYAIFQHLYQIQSRSMARNGLTYYLCLVNLHMEPGAGKHAQLSDSMLHMSEVLSTSLRHGDVYSRYSTSQYILLLSSTTYENGILIGDRIVRNFMQQYGKQNIKINYVLKGVEPVSNSRLPSLSGSKVLSS